MTVYIGADYLCRTQPGDGRRAVDVPQFDGKCRYFIEHYRYIPAGETWTREDGAEFVGEMLTPVADYRLLEAAQLAHDELRESENLSLDLLADHEYRLCLMELGL